jgi:hypothetical protein
MSAEKAKATKPAKGGAPQGKPAKGGSKGGGLNVAGERPALPKGYAPRMLTHYKENVVPGMTKTFGYTNPMELPRLLKITINVGCGDATQNPRVVESIVKEISSITGQKPAVAKARKSVSNFKLREGMPVGVFVTLRRTTMWEFLDRFISMATPRIRDFRGLPIEVSTVAATSRSAFVNRSSSPKSISTKSRKFAAWISPSSPLPSRTRKPSNCSSSSDFPSASVKIKKSLPRHN